MRAVVRRTRLIGTIVVVSILVALVLFFIEPSRYRATADVVVSVQSTPTGSRIAAVEQAVSDFEGALRSSIVAQRVAAATGVPMQEIAGHFDTKQLFGSAVVEISYVATDPDAGEQVVAAASREALVVLLSAQLGPVAQLRDLAQTAADHANDDYVAFLGDAGVLVPQAVFESKTRRMIDLDDAINGALAEGDEERAADLQEQLDRLREIWTPLVGEYESLQQARLRAFQSRAEAESAYTSATAALDAAREGASTTVAAAVPMPRVPQLVRRLLTVVVVATALAIAMIIALELLLPAGRRTRAVAARSPDRVASAPVAGASGEGARAPSRPGGASGSSKAKRRRRRRQGGSGGPQQGGSGGPQPVPAERVAAQRSRSTEPPPDAS
jgi:hypothetical protein